MGNKKQAASHSQTDPPHSPLPVSAFIGIGSNLGDRLASCREAVRRLGSTPGIRIKKISSLYETDPVDYLEQDRFYNAVVAVETSLSPDALLKECQEIERQLGKTILIPKGPRTIDLDLLFYHDQILNAPGLQIPHPAISNRAFVLVPLTEIAPDFIHPALHTSVAETLRRLNVETSRRDISTKIERIAPPGWERIPLVSNGPS
ncbi:MAG: 2-amino-4-hydroxy-6-hydroxymethyldihydropteridine diphosphokinase [Candidatus Manganitrophus sp. SA1]|nr:2-amino-4-hydroxy-6-hydroxymethyldihydropteridine diphosphokinase [Candidatus Manganitrophus morganii]